MYDHEQYEWRLKDRITAPVRMPERVPAMYPEARKYLEGRELDADVAFSFGWFPGWYRGPRIIIPCNMTGGVFWQGRLIDSMVKDGEDFKRWDSPAGYRGDAIVLLEEEGARGNLSPTVVIVEGPMDALAIRGFGFPSVAILGVEVSIPVLKHVASVCQKYEDVVLLADRDSIGKWAKWQNFLGKFGIHGQLVEPWSGFKDIAEMDLDTRERFITHEIS